MREIKNQVHKTFEASAAQFGEIGTPFFRLFGEKLVEFSDINHNYKVLDIACGRGAVTIPAAKQLLSGEITGIDFSQNMINEAKKEANKQKVENIHFKVMDAENLEFEDNCFDMVFCGFGLFFLPNVLKAFSEIKRILKPEKEFIFSTWNGDKRITWFYDKLAEYVPNYGKRNYNKDEEIKKEDFSSIGGLDKILKLGDFKKLDTTVVDVNCYYKDVDEWFANYWNTGVRMAFSQMSKKAFSNFRKEIIEITKAHTENGKIKIVMSAIYTRAVSS